MFGQESSFYIYVVSCNMSWTFLWHPLVSIPYSLNMSKMAKYYFWTKTYTVYIKFYLNF